MTRELLGYQLNRARALLLPEPYRTVMPYTMVELPRLRKLHELVHKNDELAIKGDVVECGTYNGGSGALLAKVVSQSPQKRHVWLLDSFEGLPPPSEHDGRAAARYVGSCRGSYEKVRDVFGRCGVSDDAVTIVKGWFEDTVPTLSVRRIALLHIDADWYESVHLVLKHLYDRVETGGFVVLDDFGYWEGCRKACEEFFTIRGITVSVFDVDGFGAYFQKPA